MKQSRIIITFIYLLIIVLLDSCNNDSSKNRSLISFDLTNHLKNPQKHYLSEITKDYKLIKLETNPECQISRIWKIFFTNDRIIIQDGNSDRGSRYALNIFVFDYKGNFLIKFDKVGKGPGEYTAIKDICVDEKNNFLYLLDQMNTLRKYDLQGNFIKENKLEGRPRKLTIFNEKVLVYYFMNINDDENLEYILLDKDLNVTKVNVIDKKRPPSVSIRIFKMGEVYRLWNELMNDTIYNIDDNLILSPIYHLEFPDKMTEAQILEFPSFNNYVKKSIFHNMYETSNFMFLDMSFKQYVTIFLFDLKTNEIHGVSPNEDWEWNWMSGGRMGLINDIDGGMKFWPAGNVNNNTLYSYFDIYRAMGYINERQELIDRGVYESIDVKYPKSKRSWKNYFLIVRRMITLS